VKNELALLILQYLFDRAGKQVPLAEFEVALGKDIHALRPAIEDLKTLAYISEDEYRLEILPTGRDFAQSKWV
jgi:hypothetical protein